MSRNLESLTKLTEFEPLQPEEKQQGVGTFLTNFFKIGKPGGVLEQPKSSTTDNSDSGSQEALPTWALDNETTASATETVNNVYTVDVAEGRSLPNVLKRISNLLVLKSNNLQAYSDSELKTYWMPDSVSKECYECCEKFTTFRRRHHCRVCGQIFCSSCCNQQIPGKIFGCTGDLRVCTYCSKVVLSYLQSTDIGSDLTADLRALQENLQSKYGPVSYSTNENVLTPNSALVEGHHDGKNTLKRKISVGYQEEKFAPGRSSVSYLTPEEKCRALQNSASLRNIYDEILKPSTGITLRNHWYRLRTYNDCFMGSEVVDWLICQHKANTRVQACTICQALLDGGYLECLSEVITFTDGYAFYKPGVVLTPEPINEVEPDETVNPDEPSWIRNIPQESSTTDSDNDQCVVSKTGRIPSSSSYTLDLNVGANTVYICRPHNNENTPQSGSDTENDKTQTCTDNVMVRTSEHREIVPESGWHNATNLREENSEKAAYDLLTQSFLQHKESLLQQLLSVNGLSLQWSSIISNLSDEIVNFIRPDMNHDAVELDIRHYVQFKKVPGGKKTDCKLIKGIVCSKNIAHKGMATVLENPKILLLEGSVVYQRTEGRLMSLEPVLMQEHEYLRQVSARIIALQPDLVLVQRNVSRLAQDVLRDKGVTLVLNVKQRILERVARGTQADIVTSVDSYIGRPRLGTCKRFHLTSYDLDKGGLKTLMSFEGLPMPHLAATVLLRGTSNSELVRLKQVASLILFSSYNWRLEKSFLMDEFALPPNFRSEFFNEDSRDNSPLTPPSVPSNSTLQKYTQLRQESCDSDHSLFTRKASDEDVIKPKIAAEDRKVVTTTESVRDFSDPLQSEDVILRHETDSETLSVSELPFSNRFRKALDDTIISTSPYLSFGIPYLETECGRKCKLRSFFPTQIYHSTQFDNNKRAKSVKEYDSNGMNNINNNLQNLTVDLKPVHPFVTANICGNIESNEIQTLLAHYRACGGRYAKKPMVCNVQKLTDNDVEKIAKQRERIARDNMDVLDPNNHQRLAVLFCSFSQQSNNAPAFCVNPWVIYMDFYNRDDIPLGCFLERYCFTPTYHCQSRACDTAMLHHIRRFVHATGCVSLSLASFPAVARLSNTVNNSGASADRTILMWSYCEKCGQVAAAVPMAKDTWSLSFGKYLQLRFNGGAYGRRGGGGNGESVAGEKCTHSLHQDHCQYFACGDTVASFKYTPIQLWEISLPSPVLTFKYNAEKLQLQMIDEVKSTAVKGHEIYSIVSEKLSLLPDIDIVANLKHILSKEQYQFKQRIEEVQIKLTSPTIEKRDLADKDNSNVHVSIWGICDGVIGVKQLVIETVERWNSRLSDIAKLRDTEQKKGKNAPQELEASIENKPLLASGDIDGDSTKEEPNVTSGLSKKIKSLDEHTEDDINPISYSPKCHQRSQSDGTVLTQLEEMADVKKDDKKTVKHLFSQLLASTAAFSPVTCPYSTHAHYTLPMGIHAPIVVYETELSSVVAYTLNSFEYRRSLDELILKSAALSANNTSATSSHNTADFQSSGVALTGSPNSKRRPQSEVSEPGILSFLRSNNSGISGTTRSDVSTSSNASVCSTSEASQQSVADLPVQPSITTTSTNDEKSDASKKSPPTLRLSHIEVQFEDANCNFFCRVYCAEKFAKLRQAILGVDDEAFVRSLSRCIQWNARGGKSGSTFSKTLDERFILKDMPKSEVQLFLDSAPNYFEYMERCHLTAQPTLLGKIVGIYQIIFRNSATNATLRTNVLVMENLFYNREVSQKFDLKGSMRNRLVNPDNADGEIVLLDENFLKRTCESPLYILPHSKTVLIAAIQNDTEFLATQSVMDYSLLVGLDSDNKELVLGIIDYIRTFTWDKKLETMVKKSGILGGQGKLPTIISPEEYRNRFIEAMHRYFLEVPDSWAGLGKGLDC